MFTVLKSVLGIFVYRSDRLNGNWLWKIRQSGSSQNPWWACV